MFGRLSGTGAAAEGDGKESQLGQRESQITGRRSGWDSPTTRYFKIILISEGLL